MYVSKTGGRKPNFNKLTVAVVRRGSVKKVLLKISQNSQGKTFGRVSFLINSVKKETLAQVSFYESCKIFKSTYDRRSVRIVLQPSPFFPELYLPISYY